MTSTKKVNQAKLAKAREYDKKFKNLRVSFRAHWAIYGRMAKEFRDQELYRLLGFTAMKPYLKSLGDVCYSTIQEAMNVHDAFPQMKVEEISQFPKENLKMIVKYVPESKRMKPELLKAARTMKSKELRALVNKKYEAHAEAKARIIFDVEASALKPIEEVIRMKQDAVEAEEGYACSRGHALEEICEEWKQAQ